MTNPQLLVCKHCKRDNFLTKKGLQQHMATNKTCNPLFREAAEKLAQVYGKVIDERADGLRLGYEAHDDDFEAPLAVGYAQMPNMDEESMGEVVAWQDDGDWGLDSDDEEVADPFTGYAAEARSQFKKYSRKVRDHMVEFSDDERAAITLMDIVQKKKATLDTYTEVMEWHIESTKDDGRYKQFISRQVLMRMLAERYNMPANMEDVVKKKHVVLPSSGARVQIIYQEARDQVVSLLTDPRFGDDDYLHFGNDPLAPIPRELDYLEDINTGMAYRETYNALITKPGKQLLVPIVLYIDGAVTGQFDKLSVEAMKLTLGIFNRRARDHEYAWRTLGYCPNYTKAESAGKHILEESQHAAAHLFPVEADEGMDVVNEEDEDVDYEVTKHKAQDLHVMIAAIMASYRELQDKGMVWDYKYRGKVYKDLELVFFVAFVKCDTDEADKLCGSYTCRTGNVAQLCRYCTCPTTDSDNHEAKYKPKTVSMMRKLLGKQDVLGLQQLSQQNIKNAFYPLTFGQHNDQGIHGACPMEMLHHLLLGIFMYCRDCFFDQIGPSSQAAQLINALAKILGKFFARQSDRDLPKTNFTKGIKEGKIMGKEYSGVMLLIAAILQTAKGREYLKKKPLFRQRGLIDDWSLMVETLIQWEAFLKLDRMESKHVKRLKKKHRYLMYLFKRICNRVKGMGLKTMKFHGILHLLPDMLAFGVPMNVDTGSVESHHKKTKVAAKMTQRNITVFEEQTAIRLVEFHLIELAKAELEGLKMYTYLAIDQERGLVEKEQPAAENGQVSTGGSALQVFYQDDEIVWKFRQNNTQAAWEDSITEFLHELQEHVGEECDQLGDIDVRTEHRRNGQLFRGHPNFRKNGQWNDWAIFNWGSGYGGLPGEIWCFVDFSRAPDGFSTEFAGCRIGKGVYAVIESSALCPNMDKNGDQENTSEMFVPYVKEAEELEEDGTIKKRRFYLADVESITAAACVIPDIGHDNKLRYFLVTPRSQWSSLFIQWLEQPFNIEEAEMNS